MHGDHVVHFWCKLQDRVATSSAEAELKAVCKGVSELIQCYHVGNFLANFTYRLSLHIDASACRGILLRQGAGALKHLSVRQLWVQEAIQDYQVDVQKIDRGVNLADFLCSPGKESTLDERVAEFNCRCLGMSVAYLARELMSLQGGVM